ncbi:hypothetical protein RvY_05855 [Ramazzottius varieornatus]|uniref:Peptidase S1 domain-containing protein n=1 Tax=Ramazzottius varieornatus TaxID=947166 RepID=A0A1D1UWH2_RAMVA|nr:hypothetical protein RvY_05855 [Ramazzottius varieornatus]
MLPLILGIFCLLYGAAGEGILMVQSCQSVKGEGRCVGSPESCKIVGGSIVTPLFSTPCAATEVCCFLVPTVPDTDNSCSSCSMLQELTTTLPSTTTSRTSSTSSSAPTVALPSVDDDSNLIRALSPLSASTRDDPDASSAVPDRIRNQVNFFARSAEFGFGFPFRIERKLTDKDAIKNTFCWQVALVDSSGKIFGGGALISRNYVITAAHKVANRLPRNFQVVLGKYDMKNQEEDSRIASPIEVIVNEKWDSGSFEDNIALIRIPNVKCASGNICTICPSSKPVDPVAQAQDICFATGWGSTYSSADASKLQQNQIKPISNDQCIKGLARSGIQDFVVPKSMYCGSSADPDRTACDGDGGGPLVCMNSGTWNWQLRGLVALGVTHCTNVTDAPTVYVDVGKLSGWVARKISEGPSSPTATPRIVSHSTFAPLATSTSTTTAKAEVKPPVLNRRTNENSLGYAFVFPSFLRQLDDAPQQQK